MAIDIFISEATYVDPRAGHDKFYRVYTFGRSWVAQYGRNETLGTFTKVAEAADEQAATKAATAKLAGKVRKGYTPSRSGRVSFEGEVTDVTVLDRLADRLPTNGDPVPHGDAPLLPTATATSLDGDPLPDVTATVRTVLSDSGISSVTARADDLDPKLPMRPMLASVQPDTTVRNAMSSQYWVTQFKYDGDRVVVEVADGAIRVLNRQGVAKVRNVSHHHLQPFTALHSGRWVFDGEVVGRTLVLFDVAVASDGTCTWVGAGTGFSARHAVLVHLASVLGLPAVENAAPHAPVVVAPVAHDDAAKQEMLDAAVSERREGIILRHRAGTYEQGRRSEQLVKVKFIKDADVVVSALSSSKQSAELSVYDADGNLVVVGSASTIGKDRLSGSGGVAVGQVWRVLFLYVTDPERPRLTQPRLDALRADKDPHECVLAQFADAGTVKAI
ncbi:ATP-dependent DNA ligase [Gordonia otitidis]|uniref:WGR domain-containing protein n=1 Tax=Gordonia otitidis (strain DSM 44809 / CCUG 52243 / JCM 12355 / NBRC 100426 / IFM 10032) TaxID=1108044 RepID=H5TRU4_GORO1|nr:RNA ligase family protein [Gordonia otitidis]GAB36202.1 hypothetical protein GOOTI_202_00580 [Gordonia otitidis NBRC 100426]